MNPVIQEALERDDITDEFKERIRGAVSQGNEDLAAALSESTETQSPDIELRGELM
jgi:hypothetical protein